jgi:hypothetical protein
MCDQPLAIGATIGATIGSTVGAAVGPIREGRSSDIVAAGVDVRISVGPELLVVGLSDLVDVKHSHAF